MSIPWGNSVLKQANDAMSKDDKVAPSYYLPTKAHGNSDYAKKLNSAIIKSREPIFGGPDEEKEDPIIGHSTEPHNQPSVSNHFYNED